MKLRIEDVNTMNVSKLNDDELNYLRERANQLYKATSNWAEVVRKNMVGVTSSIERTDFLESYDIICREMDRRKLSAKQNTELDLLLTKRRIWGFDSSALPPLMVRESVIALTGGFVRNPRRAGNVDVLISAAEFGDTSVPTELEKRMAEALAGQMDKGIAVTRDPEEAEAPIIPLYDLVLLPRTGLETQLEMTQVTQKFVSADLEIGIEEEPEDEGPAVELISKPLPNYHTARQLDPGKFKDHTYGKNRLGAGIDVVYGITAAGKSKIQSIRFLSSKFTVAAANKWLKSHNFKLVNEPAKVKKTSFIKNEEQRLVGGIVYAVDEVDSQGDVVLEASEIWKAMESFMLRGHNIKIMHEGRAILCPVVECFQAEEETKKSGEIVPANSWWLCAKVLDNEAWEKIKDGTLTGWSMAGKGKATPIGEGE